jgi:hypothetical protein
MRVSLTLEQFPPFPPYFVTTNLYRKRFIMGCGIGIMDSYQPSLLALINIFFFKRVEGGKGIWV